VLDQARKRRRPNPSDVLSAGAFACASIREFVIY